MSEDENTSKWDVLSLSLVLNFVPDSRERGKEIFLPEISSTPHNFQAGCCGLLTRFLPIRASCS